VSENGSRRRKGGKPRDRDPVAFLLACGQTVKSAAAAVGITERAVHYWLHDDPTFPARVRELRAELYAAAVGKLAVLSGEAADTLGALLKSETETVKLQAAKSILELGGKLREGADLAAEIEELRRQLDGGGHAGPGDTPAASGSSQDASPQPGAAADGDAGGVTP
jgi:hypothetical protein